MNSSTLLQLPHLAWSNPVFGDSYPPAASEHGAEVTRQIEAGCVIVMGDTELAEPQSEIALEDNPALLLTDRSWGR